MENQKSETDKLLEFQSSKLVAIEQTKTLLLGDGSEYNHIKKIYGFNDTDNVILESQGKILELQQRIEDEQSTKIIDEEYIINYCIDNGYVLTKISNYKGKVTLDMLKSIDDYINEDRTIRSYDNIYILASINDTSANNNNIKTSKRLSTKEPNKLIILDKLLNSNKYSYQHYRIIHEEGKLRSIYNWFTSLLKLSNHQTNTILTVIVLGIILYIAFSITLMTQGVGLYTTDFHIFFNIIFTLIFVSNLFYHMLTENTIDISLFSSGQWFYHRDDTILGMVGRTVRPEKSFTDTFEKKLKIKFLTARIVLGIIFYSLFAITTETIKVTKLIINDGIITTTIVEDEYEKIKTVEKNGILGYTYNEKVIKKTK